MDHDNDVPNVHWEFGEREDIHFDAPDSGPVAPFSELHELRLKTPNDVLRLMTAYAAIKVPRDPGDVFINHLLTRTDSWFVEVGDYGLIYMTNIVPGYWAQMNVFFWDKKLPAERVPLVQAVIKKAFELFDLHRISALVYFKMEREGQVRSPLYRFLRDVGMTREGILRRSYLWNNEIIDTAVLGILKGEAGWQLPTTSLD